MNNRVTIWTKWAHVRDGINLSHTNSAQRNYVVDFYKPPPDFTKGGLKIEVTDPTFTPVVLKTSESGARIALISIHQYSSSGALQKCVRRGRWQLIGVVGC